VLERVVRQWHRAGGVKIDAGRLARTQRETEAVSELLANIFEEDVAPVSITPSPILRR
jgi:hypothetical protein